MGATLQRWRKDGRVLLYVTLPFALIVGALLIVADRTGGWDGLGYVVYAMAVAALWALLVVGYLAWVVLRDGWRPSSIPAIVILAALLLAGAGWAYREHAEEAACRADRAFYRQLAALPAAERPAAIRSGGSAVQEPSPCALEGLGEAFGRQPAVGEPLPDEERWAALEQLLAAGLPPHHALFYRFAVWEPDPTATRLLLRRLRTLNALPGSKPRQVPDYVVEALARSVSYGQQQDEAERSRMVLEALLEEGLPEPTVLSDASRRLLVEVGLLPDS